MTKDQQSLMESYLVFNVIEHLSKLMNSVSSKNGHNAENICRSIVQEHKKPAWGSTLCTYYLLFLANVT